MHGVEDIVTGRSREVHIARMRPYADASLDVTAELKKVFNNLNGAPFSYMIFFCYGLSYGYEGHIYIGSSAPDWPGTVQKHSDTSTTLKK